MAEGKGRPPRRRGDTAPPEPDTVPPWPELDRPASSDDTHTVAPLPEATLPGDLGPPSVPIADPLDIPSLAPVSLADELGSQGIEPLPDPRMERLRAVAIGLLIGTAAGLLVVALLSRLIEP